MSIFVASDLAPASTIGTWRLIGAPARVAVASGELYLDLEREAAAMLSRE